jgi:hypothetical protein
MSVKQVQAVIDAVTNVLGDDFTPSATDVLSVITKEQKSDVRQAVLDGILNGTVVYNGDTSDTAAVKRYVNGMVDNHLRKSRILNGGSTYKPSATGSKRDPQLRELNKLLKTVEPGTDNYAKVQQHIATRTAQIQAEKTQKHAADIRASIDTSVLPDNLASMLSE